MPNLAEAQSDTRCFFSSLNKGCDGETYRCFFCKKWWCRVHGQEHFSTTPNAEAERSSRERLEKALDGGLRRRDYDL